MGSLQSGLGVGGWAGFRPGCGVGARGHHLAGEQALQPRTRRGRLATRAQETRPASRQGGGLGQLSSGERMLGEVPYVLAGQPRGRQPGPFPHLLLAARAGHSPREEQRASLGSTAEVQRTHGRAGTAQSELRVGRGGRHALACGRRGAYMTAGSLGRLPADRPPCLEPPPCPPCPSGGPSCPALPAQSEACGPGPHGAVGSAPHPPPQQRASQWPCPAWTLHPATQGRSSGSHGVRARRGPGILPPPGGAALTEHMSREQGLWAPQRRGCRGPSEPL